MRAVGVALVAIAGLCLGLPLASAQTPVRHEWKDAKAEGWWTQTYSRVGNYVVKTKLESSKDLQDPEHDFSNHKNVYYWTSIAGKAVDTYAEGKADKTGIDEELFHVGNRTSEKNLSVTNELGAETEERCWVYVDTKPPASKIVKHTRIVTDATDRTVSGEAMTVSTAPGEPKNSYRVYDANTVSWKDVAPFADPTRCDDPKFPFGLM